MAEEPYDDLDIGYVEWPMPTTEEFNAIRFLNKSGVSRLWQKIKDKFVKIPTGGSDGQALIKTPYGIGWGSMLQTPSGGNNGQSIVKTSDGLGWDTFVKEPEGGSPGQAIIKTEDGTTWGDVETDVPQATDTEYGTVKFLSNSDFCEAIGIPYNESEWGSTGSDTYFPCSLRQLNFILSADLDFLKNYTKLQYIESNGKQYIDTGIKASNSLTVSGVLENVGTASSGQCFFGANDGWLKNGLGIWVNLCAYGTQSYSVNQDRTKHTYQVQSNKFSKDSTVFYTFTSQTFSSSSSIAICALNTNGTITEQAFLKVYSFRIDNNGVTIRDFIPCMTKSSNTPGLYDRITKTFYPSYSNTNFIAGPTA